MPITFNSGCSVNASTYLWDFGDLKTSAEASPAHSYTSAGKFIVKLTVKNTKGVEHSTTQTLDIAKVTTVTHFGEINANETWKADVIHLVFSSVTINDATVTIEPGTTVRFMQGATLAVGTKSGVTGATLIAKGAIDKPILLTADANTPTAGYWRNIKFGAGDSGNSIVEYCTIEYAGGSDIYGDALIKIYGSAVTIQNNILRKSAGYGVYVDTPGSFKIFTNNVLSECPNGSLLMDPEAVPGIGLNNTLVSHIDVENGYIKAATAIWKKLSVPYHMIGTLYVGSEVGTSWTIEPGVTIKLPSSSDLLIGGFTTSKATLIANGTSTEPITFTSIKTNPTITDRWGGLQFGVGTNALTSMKYCVIENGGFTGNTAERAEIIIKDCSLNIESTKVLNSVDFAILMNSKGNFAKFINNTIDNPASVGLYIHCNWAHTIGTGNTFNAARGIVVETGIIAQSSATWIKQPVPYFVTGQVDSGLSIYNSTPEGAKLTLAPGVQLLMDTHGNISAGGSGKGAFVASGTAADPILITSSRNPKNKGDWGRIQFGTSTTSGILNYCTIEYGGYNTSGMIEVSYTNTPAITNCTIRNSGSYGIVLQSASPTMSGNTFSGNTLADVY